MVFQWLICMHWFTKNDCIHHVRSSFIMWWRFTFYVVMSYMDLKIPFILHWKYRGVTTFPGTVPRHIHSPKLDMSYLFWRLTMSSFRIAGPLGSYRLSLGHVVCTVWLHVFHSHFLLLRYYTPVIDVLIDLLIDWSVLRDSVMLICDLNVHEHSCKTCSMNNLMIAKDPLQTADLETFL